MIIYDFRCEREHRFEGWFSSQGDCERQVEAAQVRCPVCDSSSVSRVPSALHVKSSAREPAPVPARPAGTGSMTLPAGVAGEPDPAKLREAVERLRSWVAATEDVGAGFADEARRIHNQEAPERSIRGVTTPDEARALHDEGIPVLPLPAHLVDKLH
ncbi:MAG: DUF1178 family protein [Burkholderiales bacterium]|nr:DUF1178 family protein [Burkholderiales bacterium]